MKHFDDWAEDTFQQSGSGTGVTINRSSRDRRGWDFIAEWDVERDRRLPADRQKVGRTARVQVKSSHQSKPVARLKLSNAMRFAEAVEPCFIVLYWLNAKTKKVEVYARHFDHQLMERTLKRAREADRDGDTDHHKIILTVPMSEGDLHTDDLLEWMMSAATEQPAEYAKRKAELFDSVGYERVLLAGTVRIAAKDIDAFHEHAMGLNSEFKPEWIDLRDARFGIPAGTPLVEGVPTHFALVAKPERALFEVKSGDGDTVVFEGESRSIPTERFTAGETLIGSFVSRYVRARMYDSNRVHINYSFKANEPDDLHRLVDALRFFLLLDAGPAEGTFIIRGERLTLGEMGAEQKNDHSGLMAWGLVLLNQLTPLLKRRSSVQLALRDMIDGHEELRHFVDCISPGGSTLRMTSIDPLVRDMQVSGLLGYAYLTLAGQTFAVLYIQPFLEKEEEGDQVILRFGDPIHKHRWAETAPLSNVMSQVRRRFGQTLKRSPHGTLYVDNGDMISGTRAATSMGVKAEDSVISITGQ